MQDFSIYFSFIVNISDPFIPGFESEPVLGMLPPGPVGRVLDRLLRQPADQVDLKIIFIIYTIVFYNLIQPNRCISVKEKFKCAQTELPCLDEKYSVKLCF